MFVGLKDDQLNMASRSLTAVPNPLAGPRKISLILENLAREADGNVTIEQIRQAFGDRSFATLFVLFACLNLLPLPPGTTLIFGPPMLLLAFQMVSGRSTVWLPRFLLEKSVSAERFRELSERFTPKLRWLERFIRPRFWPFPRNHGDRVIGLMMLVLATAATVPVPFGNWLPALSCALVGLALSQRDGLLFAVALISTAISLALLAAIVGAAGALAGILF